MIPTGPEREIEGSIQDPRLGFSLETHKEFPWTEILNGKHFAKKLPKKIETLRHKMETKD
jgi:hypothetical protein